MAIFLLVGTPVRADWVICNKTAEKMDVAVAYVNPAGGFISEGWWTLQYCGGCAKVMRSRETSDHANLFYHARGKSRVIDGDTRFCTKEGAFMIGDHANCGERGLSATSFQHTAAKVSEGGTYTTSLTGDVPGKLCMD
jgi:uncharacterized membrane protein